MKPLFLLLTLALSLHQCWGQNKARKEFGLIHHSITDKKLGVINFYVSDTLHEQTKPLLLFLDGSGNNALFTYRPDTDGKLQLYSSIPFHYKSLSLTYHIVCISKPNVPLTDTLLSNEFPKENAIYDSMMSADWRVLSASKVLDYVLKNYSVDQTKIVAMGYSEGGQVAPRLSLAHKKITHCIAFVGGGLNQLFDQIIENRIAAQKGEMSQQEAQQRIDSLYLDFEKIYRKPRSTTDFWYGHTYLRWSSFCSTPTLSYLVKLSIPTYIAQGTDDQSTSILSSDYIRLEFLRLGKTNLTHKIYPDCDHMFNKVIKTGETLRYDNILDTVINDALKWLGTK